MMAQDPAVRGHKFAGNVRKRISLLGHISVNELLVISAGDKTYLLRVRLLRQRQTILPRQLADLRLIHVAQRETRAAKLFLRETKEKVSLVLRSIGGAAQQPPVALRVKLAAGVVSCGQQVSADLAGGEQQLVKLQMVV